MIDSTDFKIKGFHHIPKTNKLWSYKLNGPGRRYQLLTDGNGVPLKIWGGYSPKVYDGHWIPLHRRWLNHNLRGCYLFGDSHYWSAQDDLDQVTLIATMPKTVKPKHGVATVGTTTIMVNDDDFKLQQKVVHPNSTKCRTSFWSDESNFQCIHQKNPRWRETA